MAELSSQSEETECSVCKNYFTTPKILPCGHLLCRQCLISWVNQRPNAGCPLCRFPIADPQVYSERSSADVADIMPTDFVMEALVENAQVLAKDPVCCVCDDVKAESICLHCLAMLCPACTKAHKKLAMTRSHDVKSLSSVTPESLTASRPAVCAEHKDTQADFFCVDHDLAICASCSASKHKDCSGVRELQDEIKSTEKCVEELIDSLVNAKHNLEEAIAQVDMRIVAVNDSEEKEAANVDMACDRLQKLVDEYCNKLKEKSRNSHSQKTISTQAQTYWLQWVEAAFPDLDSRANFLPPVHVNPVTTGQSSAGQSSLLTDTDVRDDADLQRVLCCLQKMSEQNREIFVAVSQVQLGQYLGQHPYAAMAGNETNSSNITSALSRNLSDGNFDLLIIHRQYGLVVLKAMCFGENLEKLKMSRLDLDNNIRQELKDAVSQLDKAEAMLSQVVSDVTPGLRITKTVAFPNLTARQIQQAISDDPQLTQDVCRCLGTTDPANITGLCLCSDQLSDPGTPCDVSSDVLRELGNWWQRRVAVSGSGSHVTCDLYKTLVARLCGPAMTVAVPCTSPPRLCVKTLRHAVSFTGEIYTAHITLFPEQVHLLNTAPPRLFVSGPPGTGKSVVLLLVAVKWLRCGNDVYIVSTWLGSRAACVLLYHLLLNIVNSQETGVIPLGQPHLLQCDFTKKGNVEKAVNDLSQAARGGSLFVIAEETGPVYSGDFHTFCDELVTQVPRLHLWAASCYHGHAPAGWQVECLTRPLRSPPAVVREVQQDKAITETRVQAYSEREVSDHTDGPPVIRLYHPGQGHSGDSPNDCVRCGREVGSFLHSLRVGVPVNVATTSTTVTTTSSGTPPPCLQWRDVLVLCWYDASDQSSMMTGLREAGIPVRVMKDDDTEDVVTALSDVVWVAGEDLVRGLERKVVVCVGDVNWNTTRLHAMSRCTSQLVIVSPD